MTRPRTARLTSLTALCVTLTWPFALAVALTACGGGGGDASSNAAARPAPGANAIVVDCTGCGATSPTTFVPGSSAGVWRYVNQSGGSATAQVSISGLTGQSVYMTLANPTGLDIALPPGGNYRTEVALFSVASSPLRAARKAHSHTEDSMLEFNRQGFKNYLNPRSNKTSSNGLAVKPLLKATTGDTRRWTDCLSVEPLESCNATDHGRDTTLVEQRSTQDGRTVNFWVENTERGANRITDRIVSDLISAYVDPLGIHDSIKALGGEPWGTTLYPDQLIADNRQIDIVVANLTPDAQPTGVLGYFFSGNNFLSSQFSPSNEAVMLFIDAEAIYLNADLTTAKTALAHEATHMTSFFRRNATRATPAAFDLWLEETTAMAAEDITANRITPGFNPVRDERLPFYLSTRSGNCSLTDFQITGGTCFSYDVNGVFAAYLVRQLGVDFYKALLDSPHTDSVTALDQAIKAFRPASSLGQELRSWAQVTFAATPDSDLPAGYGYRSVPIAPSGFDLPGIDLISIGAISRFSGSSPGSVRSRASVSWKRPGSVGTFAENVIVPAGTALTITINN
jgi:Peptidase M30